MIARVTLEIALGKELDYAVPAHLEADVHVGSRVRIPLGKRQVMGVVTALAASSRVESPREIEGVVGKRNLVTAPILSLARWMSGYYCCPIETVLKCVLPGSVRTQREKFRRLLWVRAIEGPAATPRLTPRQREIWEQVRKRGRVPMAQALRSLGTTPATLRRLEALGLVEIGKEVAGRDPFADESILPSRKLDLNPAQKQALESILEPCGQGRSGVFLLHGVTGSGKTEVYLQAMEACLERGRGAIMLVPEISLTPQTVERFKARFEGGSSPARVAVLHSHLSDGERHDEWHRIRDGSARIAIGARSAIFAPVERLGLIVVDEEHETSYKQGDGPRYQARDLAVLRARNEDAVAVLGSATPSLESYHNALEGKYRLLSLPDRADSRTLPRVIVVDMRLEARREKGVPIFSRRLREGIARRLEKKEQVILFLNRRGYASSLQCLECGYVAGCPRCSLSLTFHRSSGLLRCHLCGHRQAVPKRCPEPSCGGADLRLAGIGTQRVEEALGKLFPRARVRRMDADTLRRKNDYRRFLQDFRSGRTDILLGTQMIAKGLHFPNVTLVGIVLADMGLHIPDFRAGERTFQLLTQVAGRAGRGDVEGQVIVQAYTPFHPAIQHARHHDFTGFYQQEIEHRREHSYPPVNRLCSLTLRGRDEEATGRAAEELCARLEAGLAEIFDLIVSGPAPALVARAEDHFRFQILLRTRHMPALARRLGPLVRGLDPPGDVRIQVDVDPIDP